MNCDHEKVIIYPNNVWIEEDRVGVKDLETDSTLFCQNCKEELPLEDLYLWDSKDITVGIPSEIDGEQI